MRNCLHSTDDLLTLAKLGKEVNHLWQRRRGTGALVRSNLAIPGNGNALVRSNLAIPGNGNALVKSNLAIPGNGNKASDKGSREDRIVGILDRTTLPEGRLHLIGQCLLSTGVGRD